MMVNRAHFEDALSGMLAHWRQNEIRFDAILVGYLGSIPAVKLAEEIITTMLEPDGVSIVDPAFGDHGRIYSGLSEEYASEMEKLCMKAHVIIPNVTEAAFFAGMDYQDELDETYVGQLLNKMKHPCVVMTGVGYQKDETGVLLYDQKKRSHYVHPKIGKNCHGTGDMFAASFTGAWMQGKTKEEALKIAADFVCQSIQNTVSAPVHWYGVKFEIALPELIRNLQS